LYGTTFDVIVIERSVRPWKALSKTITACRPVATRAILDRVLDRFCARVQQD